MDSAKSTKVIELKWRKGKELCSAEEHWRKHWKIVKKLQKLQRRRQKFQFTDEMIILLNIT